MAKFGDWTDAWGCINYEKVDKQFLAISFASNIASIVEPVSISFAAVEFKGLKVDMSFRNSKLRINVSVLEISGPKFN